MNLDKTTAVLKKINRLYELINSLGEASQTEKDLLKAYILDLYEAVVLQEEEDQVTDLDVELMKEEIKKKKKLDKKLKKQMRKRAEEIIDSYEEEEEEDDDEALESLSDIMAHEEEEEEQNDNATQDEEPETDSEPVYSDEMASLFEFSNSSELSDKLANTPLADLTRAMGINEKIFTVNELFGGNAEEMDNLLLALNGLDNFDEAKSVLIRSVASKYDWDQGAKFKKAKNFVRLVRRRYL